MDEDGDLERTLVAVGRRLPDLSPVLRRLTATASATWPASGTTSTTWPGSASTPSGSRRSSARPWPTSATTSATTATSIPLFGTLADFDRCVADAHACGLRVVIDWVPNHTSDQHPWFLEARSSPRQPQAGLVHLAGPGARTAARPTTGSRPFTAARRGRSTRPPASTTCTCSCPSSPTSTGRNPAVVGGDARRAAVLARPRRRRVPRRRHPRDRQGPGPARRPARRQLACPTHRSTTTRRPTSSSVTSARCSTATPGDRMMVGEVYLLSTAEVAALLRPRRRAAPRLQLPAAVHALGRRRAGAAGSTGPSRSSTPIGAWPTLGAVEPRHPPPSHPLRRPRPGPGRRPCCCSRCGARRSCTRARSWASRTPSSRPSGRRPRRARRLPGADPVGRRRPHHGWPRRAWLPFPPEPERAMSRRCGATRPRSCTCTGAYSRPGTPARPSSSATCACWTPPNVCSCTSGPTATTAG